MAIGYGRPLPVTGPGTKLKFGHLDMPTLGRFLGPGIRANIEITPSPLLLVSEFNRMGNDIRSFRVPLDRARRWMQVSIRKNFDVEGKGRSPGGKWQELEPFTKDRREALGFGKGPILERTGLLKRVATQLNIWEFRSRTGSGLGYMFVRELPRAKYGHVHQSGHEFDWSGEGRVRGDIPARPFLLFQPEDRVAIDKIFTEWVEERTQLRVGRRGAVVV